jgi:hypothetical protein
LLPRPLATQQTRSFWRLLADDYRWHRSQQPITAKSRNSIAAGFNDKVFTTLPVEHAALSFVLPGQPGARRWHLN